MLESPERGVVRAASTPPHNERSRFGVGPYDDVLALAMVLELCRFLSRPSVAAQNTIIVVVVVVVVSVACVSKHCQSKGGRALPKTVIRWLKSCNIRPQSACKHTMSGSRAVLAKLDPIG